jgi:hypothetical protein
MQDGEKRNQERQRQGRGETSVHVTAQYADANANLVLQKGYEAQLEGRF